MKLSQLLAGFDAYRMGDAAQTDVRGLSIDSREVKNGYVFVAIRGSQSDGHQFIDQAIHLGAIAIIVEDSSVIPQGFRGAVVVDKDTRSALVKLASLWYGSPASEMLCVGVTGTNGKTTTAYLVEHVLNGFGWQTGVMGTIDHHVGEQRWPAELTTPDAITLQKRLADFQKVGAQAAVFEVSSHALQQKRADGIPFDIGVFTNLSRDHLDYHGTMESYFSAKARLFTELIPKSPKSKKRAIVNIDDTWGGRLVAACSSDVWTVGQTPTADLQFEFETQSILGSHFFLKTPMGESEVFVPVPGAHNVYNAVAAIAVGLSAGASLSSLVASVATFAGVPGRLQKVSLGRAQFGHVFVDYAHTPDALNRVLSSLRDVLKQSDQGGKLICLFGCGGDRDKGKRPEMGRIAVEQADAVVITSDNPRTEPPVLIIEDILAGVPDHLRHKLIGVEEDRKAAIELSLQKSNENDVILIAGKGHEDYQIIGHEKLHFSDELVVRKWIQGN